MEAANCEYDANTMEKRATIRGYQSLPKNELQPILDHLTNKGPLSAAMYVNRNVKEYETGVFDGCPYNESLLINHAVQVGLAMSTCVCILGIIDQVNSININN